MVEALVLIVLLAGAVGVALWIVVLGGAGFRALVINVAALGRVVVEAITAIPAAFRVLRRWMRSRTIS